MYKNLLRDASLYSVSSFLARGLSFITVPIYTRLLSPADYGALDLLSLLAVLVTLAVGLALDQAVARFYIDAADQLEKKRIASTVLFYTVGVYVLFIPVVSPMATYLAHGWLDNQVDEKTVVLVFIYIWVHSIFYIGNNQLKYLFLSKQFALCNIGNILLSVVLSLAFVVHFELGVFGIFLGMTLGQTAFALLSIYFARESYALLFDWKSLKLMLGYSLPLMPATLAFYATLYVDRYAINDLRGLEDLGIYAIGARLATLINLFLTGFQGAWHPIVMKNFRENDAPEKFRTVFNVFLFAVLSILMMLSLFGREVLLLLTTATFSRGFVVVPLLVLSAILMSIGAYFTYGIQIACKSYYRLILSLSSLAMNMALNYLLIPHLGIIGAALATTLSFLLVAIVGMIISQQLYYVPYKWGNITFAALLAVVISNSVMFLDLKVTIVIMMAKLALAIVVAVGLARVLEVPLNVSSVKRISQAQWSKL